jgi:hypothetical protein
MTNAAAVGVIDHKTHIPMLGLRSRILIDKAAPTAMSSTSTEKMAPLRVSVSFVNMPLTLLPTRFFGGLVFATVVASSPVGVGASRK